MERDFIRRAGRDAGIILLAAVALGFVYNSASPLGVRAQNQTAVTNPIAANLYRNETLSISPQTERAGMAATNQRIQNETVALVVSSNNSDNTPRVIPTMTWPQVKAMGDNVTLVDAREPAAFEAGHVPNAISLPTRLLAERIEKFLADVPRERKLIVYCANPQCPLSHNLARALADQYGYKDVHEVPGGYAEWLVNESPK